MRIPFKTISTALIAAGLSFSVVSIDPLFSEPTIVEAATAKQKKAKKVKKIKADTRKKIAKAKRVQIKKNNTAKAVKANDKHLKQLNAQKRNKANKIKALNKTITNKKALYVAIPLSTSDFNGPDTGFQNPKSYQGKHAVRRIENLPSKITDPKIPAHRQSDSTQGDFYGYVKSSTDKSQKVRGKLTAAQQNELNDYALTLINSYLKQQGLAPVKRSSNMDARMRNLITRRENAKTGFVHTTDEFGAQTFNQSSGLFYNGENLGGIMAPPNTSMLELKVSALNSITAMIYQDGFSDWGHRENFKRASGKQASGGVEKNTGLYSDWFGYMFVFGTADELGNVKMNNQPVTFASTHRKNVSPAQDIKKLNLYKKELAQLNKQIHTRNAALNRVMNKKFKANGAEFNKAKKQANRVMDKQLRRV